MDSQPSRARYRFLVPVSTFTLFTFSLTASSLLTAATINSFLPSTRIPPHCINRTKHFMCRNTPQKSLIRTLNWLPLTHLVLQLCTGQRTLCFWTGQMHNLEKQHEENPSVRKQCASLRCDQLTFWVFRFWLHNNLYIFNFSKPQENLLKILLLCVKRQVPWTEMN